MLHGFNRDNCELRNVDVENATFSPGTCGYLCPTKAAVKVKPDVVDNNIFFPMNWTFHLSCDRIRTNDCIFNPITRAPAKNEFKIHIKRVTSPFRNQCYKTFLP